MEMKAIASPDAPAANGYAQAIRVDGPTRLMFVSGQIPVAVDGSVPDGFEAQARLAFANLFEQLKHGGMTPGDLVKLTIFLSSREHAATMRAVRRELLDGLEVALTVIITGIFDEAWLLEIEAVAAQ